MTPDEQLQWEARWAVPAAIAAFGSAVMFVVSATLFLPEDRKGVGRVADLLLAIDEQPGAYLASGILTALAVLFLIAVFYYLFRAVVGRGGGIPGWFVYLVYAAPLLFAIGAIAGGLHAVDAADQFASEDTFRGDAADKHARDLLSPGAPIAAAQTAGTVGVAFLFVMLPLRARRVGLLTPFMGVIGPIAGVLIVFQLAGISSIVQGFWLAALGVLFLGRWPGGRGPAWESGEAEPWPSPAQRRAEMVGKQQQEPGDDAPSADPEPVPERPASRKRRKKKR